MNRTQPTLFDPALLRPALRDAFKKLDPRVQWRNPVMSVVYVGSAFSSALAASAPDAFTAAVALWLWFTVLFANFAEALAEGRSKAQAASLRGLKQETWAKKLAGTFERSTPHSAMTWLPLEAGQLRRGDVVLVEAGDIVPADGEVMDGVASVDESAITGESAPVIREAGGDFSAVTGGTRVLSDWVVVQVVVNPGETFVDRMIAMVENARRQKTPNEIALTILLVALSIVFLGVVVTLLPFSVFGVQASGAGEPVSLVVLVALLVCLIPTTIAGLLSAIGVAGMSRMLEANVIATSGRAVEAAGDVDVLLLDKTGTITLGNRQASAFVPAPGVTESELADVAQLASLADETPEGRSIVVLAKQRFKLRERDLATLGAQFVHFTAQTRMSGADLPGPRLLRKGAADAVRKHVQALGGRFPAALQNAVDDVSRRGSTPLVVADGARVLGVVELKDVIKGGIRERFAELRRMGIKTVMVTGDNRLTAAAIAAEAGVDDFLAEATPEAKLKLIRDYQSTGRLVAMTGDGTNDAPALAQADVAVAMNTGTQAAKEAGNMVDLDSNPTKLIEIVETGKQMLMTRGALTTFSIANDIAKYFAIVPAAFVGTYPQLSALNFMQLASPSSAILSAVVFNALIIVCLIPLALRGVRYRAVGAAALLRRNLAIYGLGGVLLPFIGIKAIDMLIAALGLV
ncbi:potassium-transporting ATPase subunit KdpB [Verminephrobacter aporrectodeae]|uniref:Potassium-transporting ATPase ATP-binding subunit n=2 Tax=Verminephrobacter TaxID=364316 RepID=A0ABT3KVN0_9BURK|nr:potassium-transporting ATPase subunit KdpB [Verminephrobacter aporrectodeae]MCW5222129.1 K(+)-transporting ATPase subunit B [Verminephrobacter aporrectodeae subsp. tuberculatae]MCW5291420.1 K(+)-transporting ATPase subunit B [Verminephrobacter aporrectodeae subsp. tuberculatae]MCW5322409.1 K(+)-transporting ATPase subunit B [Verminephrobacter aporrectodeae subsp. tuberculatae]MCW8165104.1 K(+)-transporting ATPase subunit B [Verminephrobacter aporrectodeae subsp. tuberculatae]MCW8170285.1 K(